jgi:hypothetical protein
MGTGFTKLTGWAPGDPAAWRDSIRYALNRAKVNGWGAWYGAAHVGIGQWEGINRVHPWDANAETWDYEHRPGATLTYNPAQPPERQVQSWSCSIRVTSWMLLSLGLPVDIGALQDEMVPRYVTPELGLLDGRGYGMAEVLRAHLPADWHANVHVFERIDWAGLWSRSGTGPFGVGLHGAYHWLNVSMPHADGTLGSPNPAPKYPAGAPIGDTLTRAEFETFGPVSAVWIDAAPPVADTDPYAPWRATVGPGLLSMMETDATLPAQGASSWLPLGVSPADIEECYGQNGTLYSWQLSSNGTSWRYTPEDAP